MVKSKERRMRVQMPTLQPVISACYNCVHNGVAKKVTVVVSPHEIRELDGAMPMVRVSWTCNQHFSCENPTCRYSSQSGKSF